LSFCKEQNFYKLLGISGPFIFSNTLRQVLVFPRLCLPKVCHRLASHSNISKEEQKVKAIFKKFFPFPEQI
jgi:hypothetical protein